MSQNATYESLKQRIQALELENAALKQDISTLKKFRNIECIFQTAPIGLAILIDQKIVRANRYLCDITGYSMQELKGSDTRLFFPDEASYQALITRKTDLDVIYGCKSIETGWQTKDGRKIDIRLTYSLIDENDFSKGMTVTVQDITTHKKNITEKKKFEKEKELLLTAMEQSPQAIFITNAEGTIEYVNGAFERQTGFSRLDCIGRDLRLLRSNKHDRQFYVNLWATISSGGTWSGHTISKRKDGSLYTADTTISSVKDENGDITNYVNVHRDISNEIEINEKIARIQKFESLGTLAGGMVHDLNNMLFPILGNAEILLLDSSAHSNETKECLEHIYESAVQAKDLVQQVLSFSRHKKIKRQPLQIQDKIDTVLKLMKPGISRNIKIKKSVDPNCPSIIADPTQIHQVIINLLSNSVHAMPKEGGFIKISLTPESVLESASESRVKPGNYICLSVLDTGRGMEKEVIDHIFEPFYTTKDDGMGTGMGLSVVYGIVKDMDGGIKVDSRLGKGSEFRVYFPLSEIKGGAAKPVMHGTNEGTCIEDPIHVLFVDDEDIILNVAKSMLDRLGCRATTMADPLAALECFRKEPLKYDLVITDMYMPQMKGDWLAETVRAIRPDIPVFLCTGFSNDITLDMLVKTGIRAVLSKPLSIKEIADKIQKVLKSKKPVA